MTAGIRSKTRPGFDHLARSVLAVALVCAVAWAVMQGA